jgi:Spy/CpxP family protein refolding chaperone
MEMKHLAKALNLTEDQKTQIKAIREEGRQHMMALHEDTNTPKEAKFEKMKAFHQEQEAKIKAILTEEQRTKYEAMQQKMQERRAAHQGGTPTAPAA